ncbi:hypothetical protein [Paenibacillus qinlingensis]|uniref:hypothetical protein n=1 Tax=Paenibacillus qinlingensis TaxID=1837343 RepID=UPI001565303F|nr:hypothetical protein [Paenibacillus qinlingensis]NQX58551.1 hypothetical protein [Paenibacillus qinlingensis]
MITTLYDIDFNIETEIDNNGTKTLIITPIPYSIDDFQKSSQVLDQVSLEILWSKHYYGISQRTGLFTDLYNTFEELSARCNGIQDYIKMQALYCDLILRYGTIIEEFAGICSAVREFSLNGTSISEYFLAYSDPMGFYNSIANGNSRIIKQIFRLPQAKFDLNRIFNNITEDERETIWKGIQVSSQLIYELFLPICESIVRKDQDSVTYYDFYNKIKHGFSPVFPFVLPIQVNIEGVPIERADEEVLHENYFEIVMIVHDKLKGQRTPAEQVKYDTHKLATPAHTWESVNLEQAKIMFDIVKDIDYLYKHLVKTYLSFSQGNKRLSLLLRPGNLITEEEQIIRDIITNDANYI